VGPNSQKCKQNHITGPWTKSIQFIHLNQRGLFKIENKIRDGPGVCFPNRWPTLPWRFGARAPGSSSPVEHSPRSLFFFSSRAIAVFFPWRLTIAKDLKAIDKCQHISQKDESKRVAVRESIEQWFYLGLSWSSKSVPLERCNQMIWILNWAHRELLCAKAMPIDKQLQCNVVKARSEGEELIRAVVKRQIQ
jgi:hypothetical protein